MPKTAIIIFGSAAAGKSSLLARVATSVSLGIIPKTAVIDTESFWVPDVPTMRKRSAMALSLIAASQAVIGGGALDPAFFTDRTSPLRAALAWRDTEVLTCLLHPSDESYSATYRAKARLRGVGSDDSHVLEGALKVRRDMLIGWGPNMSHVGDSDSILWFIHDSLNTTRRKD